MVHHPEIFYIYLTQYDNITNYFKEMLCVVYG